MSVPEIRTGLGWDSHRIASGRPLILGGVTIPSELGLDGHSDADSDPQWKGAASVRFLEHAVALAHQAGFAIVNVDSTVIIEKPKLKDYRLAIRESLARTLALPLDCVSVKFKTAEGVGPIGEGLSAEAQAIVTLSK